MAESTDPEIGAMQSVAAALEPLDSDQRTRILRWVGSRFGVSLTPAHEGSNDSTGSGSGNIRRIERERAGRTASDYTDFPEFFAAATPQTDVNRALVAAAWISRDGPIDFMAFDVNKMLTDLGYRIGNITDAFDSLIGQKPQLVLQTKKTGTSRQARKLYRITQAGLEQVSRLLSTESDV